MLHRILTKISSIHYRKIISKINKGENVQINYPIMISNTNNLVLEDNIYIGPNSYFSIHGEVIIKSGVIIGPRLKIYTGNHNYENKNMIPYDNITIVKKITIEENVWIGGDVIILPGVTIGEGAIVAAGSIVSKNVPKCAIVGGNPSRVIKYRDIENYDNLKKEDKIYLKLKKYNNLEMTYKIVD